MSKFADALREFDQREARIEAKLKQIDELLSVKPRPTWNARCAMVSNGQRCGCFAGHQGPHEFMAETEHPSNDLERCHTYNSEGRCTLRAGHFVPHAFNGWAAEHRCPYVGGLWQCRIYRGHDGEHEIGLERSTLELELAAEKHARAVEFKNAERLRKAANELHLAAAAAAPIRVDAPDGKVAAGVRFFDALNALRDAARGEP